MPRPTEAERRAVRDAFAAWSAGTVTSEQEALMDRYQDETCGDCVEGRCHWGGVATQAQERFTDERCGCARHAASVAWREPRTPHTVLSRIGYEKPGSDRIEIWVECPDCDLKVHAAIAPASNAQWLVELLTAGHLLQSGGSRE